MTLLFDQARSIDSPALAPARQNDGETPRPAARAQVLEIGLINNMPDAALWATERQFMRLLNEASGADQVRLHCFSLPAVPRGEATRARIAKVYADIANLGSMGLDGLIITGAEPRAASLRDESYWGPLTEIIDWAAQHTRSTIFSCLAAHAAVLHLDGIARRRLPQKCSGVYRSVQNQDAWLLADAAWPLQVPHSRLNDISADDLATAGYQVLSQTPEAGVDIFAKDLGSQFIFFQGHPEYDAPSLQREYLRDIGRYAAGEREDFPAMPVDYFDEETESSLAAFAAQALEDRERALTPPLPDLTLRPDLEAETGRAAATIFRNWVGFLSDHKRAEMPNAQRKA